MRRDSGRGDRDPFRATPVNRFLGLRLEAISADEVRVVPDPRPEPLQEEGIVHGGILTTLADTAAVYLVLPRLAAGERITSVDLKVNFLRAARVDGGPIRAVARPVRVGRRIVVAEARLSQEHAELAMGLFTYLRLPPAGADPIRGEDAL